MNRFYCAAAVAFLFAGGSLAQTAVPDLDQQGRRGDVARMVHEKAQRQFSSADKDKDERLTPEEVASVSTHKSAAFAQYDKDQDGFLSWQEFVGHDRWSR